MRDFAGGAIEKENPRSSTNDSRLDNGFCSRDCYFEYIRKFKTHALAGNGRWKGGKRKRPDGYILIKNRDHPFADSHGYVREHRLVMEKHIGRFLHPKEVVHHRNRNRADNRIKNLELFKNSVAHKTNNPDHKHEGRKKKFFHCIYPACKTPLNKEPGRWCHHHAWVIVMRPKKMFKKWFH